MKTKRINSSGIALLEAVAFVFISLPLVIGIFAVYDLLDIKSRLDNLANTLIADNQLKPFKLETGDQLWILQPIDYGSPRELAHAIETNPRLKLAIDQHHQRLTNIADTAETELRKILGNRCDATCKSRYRVELRIADVNIENNEGRLEGGAINCSSSGGGRCRSGLVSDTSEGGHNPHRYLRVRGDLNMTSKEFYDSLVNFIRGNPYFFAQYNIPSGLHKANILQYYGENAVLTANEMHHYTARVYVMGINLQVDLKNTITGRFLKLVRLGIKNIPMVYSVLSKNDSSYTDTVFSVEKFIVPRNDL